MKRAVSVLARFPFVARGRRITVEAVEDLIAQAQGILALLALPAAPTPMSLPNGLSASKPMLAPAATYRSSLITRHSEIRYTYDSLYRLTAADYSTGDYYRYTYDAVGNRLREEKAVGGLRSAVHFAYNGLGDRLQQTMNSQTTTCTLDLAAGLIKKP